MLVFFEAKTRVKCNPPIQLIFLLNELRIAYGLQSTIFNESRRIYLQENKMHITMVILYQSRLCGSVFDPQGSVFGPILSPLYTKDIEKIIHRRGRRHIPMLTTHTIIINLLPRWQRTAAAGHQTVVYLQHRDMDEFKPQVFLRITIYR